MTLLESEEGMPDYKPITGEQIHQAFQAAERKLHGLRVASYEVCAVNGIKERYEELANRLNQLDTLNGHILYDLRRSICPVPLRPWEELSPYAGGEGQGFHDYLA